jgi:hypothetical protein
VDHRPPRPAATAEPADWLIDRVDLWDDLNWPTGRVGSGFAAYARLLHLLGAQPGSPTWAAVAHANGRILHPSAQWEKISSPSSSSSATDAQRKPGWPEGPAGEELMTWMGKALSAVAQANQRPMQLEKIGPPPALTAEDAQQKDDQPADRAYEELIGWASKALWAQLVAQVDGRPVDWEKIGPQPALTAEDLQRMHSQPNNPAWGELDNWALKELCNVLARHTTTPQTCYFAVWEGGGWLHEDDNTGPFSSSAISYYAPDGAPSDVQPPQPAPDQWQLELTGPTFSLPLSPDRTYYLFEGHLDEAARIGHWVNEDFFIPQSPNFFWPADHTWCVATEVDDDSTFIGGTRELIDELCASQIIEALEIPPGAPYEDHLNA